MSLAYDWVRYTLSHQQLWSLIARPVFRLALSSLAALSFASLAFTDGHSAALEASVKARNAQMSMIGYHTGLLGAIAKAEVP